MAAICPSHNRCRWQQPEISSPAICGKKNPPSQSRPFSRHATFGLSASSSQPGSESEHPNRLPSDPPPLRPQQYVFPDFYEPSAIQSCMHLWRDLLKPFPECFHLLFISSGNDVREVRKPICKSSSSPSVLPTNCGVVNSLSVLEHAGFGQNHFHRNFKHRCTERLELLRLLN